MITAKGVDAVKELFERARVDAGIALPHAIDIRDMGARGLKARTSPHRLL